MSNLYLPNVIAEAAVTSIALQRGITRRIGVVLATEREIASAIRRAGRDVLGDSAWLRLPPELPRSIHASGGAYAYAIYVGTGKDTPPAVIVEENEDRRSEPAVPQVIGADSLPALGGAAAHQKESAESGAPHISAEAQP